MIPIPNLHKTSGKIALFLSALLLVLGGALLFGPTPPSKEALSIVNVLAIKEKTVVMEGKGFLFSADGLVFTSAHLVEDTLRGHYAQVRGRLKKMEIIMVDDEKDIALMRIEEVDGKMPSIDIKSGTAPAKGSKAFAFTENGQIQGVVKERDVSIDAGTGYIKKSLNGLLELEMNLTSGQSGLPIFGEKGDFIGMLVAVDSNHPKRSFAIPVKTFQEFLREYLKREFGL